MSEVKTVEKSFNIPVSQLIVMEGINAETNEPYCFVRFDNDLSNDKDFIADCKSRGVKIWSNNKMTNKRAFYSINE